MDCESSTELRHQFSRQDLAASENSSGSFRHPGPIFWTSGPFTQSGHHACIEWVTDHAHSHDEGLVGLLEVGHELFEGWLWACAIEEPDGFRLLHSRPLSPTARA